MGGYLAARSSAAKQYEVERYFTAQKSLSSKYWTGISRNGSFSLYAFPDASYVSQVADNEPSYAHWSWMQPSARKVADSNCVLAAADGSYDMCVTGGIKTTHFDPALTGC
jgi:hypothetical protein